MKKFTVLCVLLTFVQLSFIYAAKPSKITKETQKEPELPACTIILHDNCPKTTAALRAEIALKTTVENYNGTITINTSDVNYSTFSKILKDYISYCQQIKNSINRYSDSNVTLSFSTSNEASLSSIELTDQNAALTVLEILQSLTPEQTSVEIRAIYSNPPSESVEN